MKAPSLFARMKTRFQDFLAAPALGAPDVTGGDDPYADTRSPIRIGLIIILVTFVGLGGWAAFAPLSQGAVASGKLIVESQRKEIQHFEGGIVAKIAVKDGDRVRPGDVLVELDDTRARAQLQIVEGQLDAYRAFEARLTAERDGLEDVTFPADLEAKAQNNEEVAKSLGGQRDMFTARKMAIKSQTDILDKRVTQLREMSNGLRAQVQSKSEQLRTLADEIKGLQELYAKGYASKSRLLALQRSEAETAGERGKYLSDIASSDMKVGETRLEVIQVQKKFEEEVVSDLRTTQQKVLDLTEQWTAARDVLNRTRVRAPVEGIIVGLKLHTLGGVINPGTRLLEIVPQNRKLLVQAKIQTHDIDQVQMGAEAEVRLLPFKQRTLPILVGQVTAVSADTLEDERTGESYYTANVEISEDQIKKLEGHRLVPGMPADVIIKSGEYTVLQYLLGPLTDSLARAFRG
ncbi:HlyD family type I secretion periplasmic adaptor subunit [Govanella unica]|uniref:Membrane fusion protein (MFP) family protein n=1 Tax=Govanella unica TaxID=2975056 RepID=A0A9X3TVF8_9PROT|nr:HlyD family type I secretion periplasmic adaptor subunit [Govania unica]MDA5192491.1 HlyD family type I secretion periplasmic adaptor subunit [Govania unica]